MTEEKPKVTLEVLEQDGILTKCKYDVDPSMVLVGGIYLSELIDEHKRASRRSGVIR